MAPRQKDFPTLAMFPKDSDPRDELALDRMRARGGDWEWAAMNWYVSFSRRDIGNVSGGDLRNLQEELVAIARSLFFDSNPPTPTQSEIGNLQGKVRAHLNEVLERGQTQLGPFKTLCWVVVPQKARWFGEAPPKYPEVVSWDRVLSEDQRERTTEYALYYFGRLLKAHASSIRRCEFCGNMFLQFRRSGRHCDRKCQNRAVMREIRKRDKAKQQLRKTRRKMTRRVFRKEGHS